MFLSAEVVRLPKYLFIGIDVLLTGAATFLAFTSPNPTSGGVLIAIVVLVALGAVFLAIPFIADYGKKTDEMLNERQNQIAALAQSTATSAEQIGIAAASLPGIGETATRGVKALEALSQKLHEKIAELKAQLNEISATGDDALEQEVQTLRSAESDRLIGAIDQLASTAKDLDRLQTLSQTHASQVTAAFGSLPLIAAQAATRTADGVAQATEAALKEIDTRFAQHRSEMAAASAAAQTQAASALESSLARASAEFDLTCTAFLGRWMAQTESASRALDDKLALLAAASIRLEKQLAETATAAAAAASAVATPQRKTRTPRGAASTENAPPQRAPLPEVESETPEARTESANISVTADTSASFEAPVLLEPLDATPLRAHADANVSPVADTASSFEPLPLPSLEASPLSATGEVSSAESMEAVAQDDTPAVPAIAPIPETESAEFAETVMPTRPSARAPSPKPASTQNELFPTDEDLSFEDEDAASSAALTADGATRLLVTAYIGIGNKLFLRGNGPGLTWEKGVPLQFVSIGKWRWESNEASLPLSARLYKNDQIECSAIGTFTLEPGRLRELSATF